MAPCRVQNRTNSRIRRQNTPIPIPYLYVQARGHDYTAYGPDGVDTQEDILELFDKVNTQIHAKEYHDAFDTLLTIDKTVNTARIKEGFDIPKQQEVYNPNKVATEKSA